MTEIDLAPALAALREGRVVIHPTETCYGLACDLTNPDAVARLFSLKQRPRDKPVSALFPSVDAAKQYVIWNDRADSLAREWLPGPLTLVLPMRTHAPLTLHTTPVIPDIAAGHSLGIRVSSHPTAMAMVAAYEHPISTTSANLHGQPNPYSLEDIRAQFGDGALHDVVLLDGGTLPMNPPSTVVDLTQGDDGRVLRDR